MYICMLTDTCFFPAELIQGLLTLGPYTRHLASGNSGCTCFFSFFQTEPNPELFQASFVKKKCPVFVGGRPESVTHHDMRLMHT